MNYFYILNENTKYVVYTHVTNNKLFVEHINEFIKNNKDIELILIYSSESEIVKDHFTEIKLIYSKINFENCLLAHNFNKQIYIPKQKKQTAEVLYNSIGIGYGEMFEVLQKNNKTDYRIVSNLKPSLDNAITNLISSNFGEHIEDFEPTKKDFINFLRSTLTIPSNFNINDFFETYCIPTYNKLISRTFFRTVVFENVFYRNKGFYNRDGSFYNIDSIKNDIEYRNYNKIKLNINYEKSICVESPVLFLDYIYDFYNFGEFWDIIQRIINTNVPNIDIYGLSNHKINNIEYYFQKANIQYPLKFIRDYNWKDVEQETNNGSTYFFKKLYITTINNSCRGSVTPWSAFKMNELFNPHEVSEKGYNLYLTRGKEKRGIVNEEHIIQNLLGLGFIILDGSETLDKQMYYFTNAKIIIGAHGSLMKNIVWCKKNPLFIELFPPTRSHLCFIGNAQQLGFKTLPILCEANEKEEIILNDTQRKSLLELIKYLYADG